MTIKELKELLAQYDENAKIAIGDFSNTFGCNSLSVREIVLVEEVQEKHKQENSFYTNVKNDDNKQVVMLLNRTM